MPHELEVTFASLSLAGKARFLARVAHLQTIYARDAYAHAYDSPNGTVLRDSNEFIHRVLGRLMATLSQRDSQEQAAAAMRMIIDKFSSYPGGHELLSQRLEEARRHDMGS